MLPLTKVPAPAMPTIRPDPSVPARSLRVITAAEASGESDAGIPGAGNRPLNMPVVKALQATPNHAPRQTAHMLFKDLFAVLMPAS